MCFPRLRDAVRGNSQLWADLSHTLYSETVSDTADKPIPQIVSSIYCTATCLNAAQERERSIFLQVCHSRKIEFAGVKNGVNTPMNKS